jgi:hypothetical protein
MTATPDQQKALFDYCFDFAKTMLMDSGEFHPFGADITAEGQQRAVGGWNGEEHPNAGEMYTLMKDAFVASARNGEITAAAIAANVDVPAAYDSPYPDAVRIQLEADGNSRFIYVPYRINTKGLFRKSRTVQFAESFAVAISDNWFGS